MKSFYLLCFVIIPCFITAQEDDFFIDGNAVTYKDIAPVWPGCEGNEAETEQCFNLKLAKLIKENFNFNNGYTAADKGSRIVVFFIVSIEGNVEILKVEGGSVAMQEEAQRVILLMPRMKPGKAGGKPKAISYTVPFNF